MFIANCGAQIQSMSNAEQWQYIRANENLTDLLSRGIKSTDLLSSSLWWHRAKKLSNLENKRDTTKDTIPYINKLPELCPKAINTKTYYKNVPYLIKFSTFNKLQRVFVRRFEI